MPQNARPPRSSKRHLSDRTCTDHSLPETMQHSRDGFATGRIVSCLNTTYQYTHANPMEFLLRARTPSTSNRVMVVLPQYLNWEWHLCLSQASVRSSVKSATTILDVPRHRRLSSTRCSIHNKVVVWHLRSHTPTIRVPVRTVCNLLVNLVRTTRPTRRRNS
jgi:hypothetical protein